VVSEPAKDQLNSFERLNELNEQIDSEIHENAAYDAIAHDLAEVKVINIVCEYKKCVGGCKDAAFVKNFVIVR
jgi:hypothetical protein